MAWQSSLPNPTRKARWDNLNLGFLTLDLGYLSSALFYYFLYAHIFFTMDFKFLTMLSFSLFNRQKSCSSSAQFNQRSCVQLPAEIPDFCTRQQITSSCPSNFGLRTPFKNIARGWQRYQGKRLSISSYRHISISFLGAIRPPTSRSPNPTGCSFDRPTNSTSTPWSKSSRRMSCIFFFFTRGRNC